MLIWEDVKMKATLPNGIVLEGPSEEVTKAIRAIQGEFPTAPTTPVAGNNNHASNGNEERSDIIWTQKRAEAFLTCLYGHQRKLIEFLLDRNGSALQEDVMRHLGLKTGNSLAGVRSCITRNARRETDYKKAKVIKWNLGDNGKWYYQLVPEVHEVLKQAAKK
jgi:hypothetical protein